VSQTTAAIPRIAKYLKRGKKATARLKVRLADPAGNRKTTKAEGEAGVVAGGGATR
jgi:hypothetical protein